MVLLPTKDQILSLLRGSLENIELNLLQPGTFVDAANALLMKPGEHNEYLTHLVNDGVNFRTSFTGDPKRYFMLSYSLLDAAQKRPFDYQTFNTYVMGICENAASTLFPNSTITVFFEEYGREDVKKIRIEISD